MLVLLVLLLVSAAPAARSVTVEADAIVGTWLAPGEHGSAHVTIERRGDQYEGTIVWLDRTVYGADDPKGMAGKPVVDRENPDPKLRRRPLVGIQLMSGFQYNGHGEWNGGRIYDPESGKTYKCQARLDGPDTLRVRGYIGFSFIGRTTTWTRVTAKR